MQVLTKLIKNASHHIQLPKVQHLKYVAETIHPEVPQEFTKGKCRLGNTV